MDEYEWSDGRMDERKATLPDLRPEDLQSTVNEWLPYTSEQDLSQRQRRSQLWGWRRTPSDHSAGHKHTQPHTSPRAEGMGVG